MKFTFLGTASCFPTPTRGVSCIALQLSDGQIWLFDCGECSQVQLQKSSLKPGKITKIFITHLHGDHLFGLPGLLCTLGNGLDPEQAENKIVDIYGPQGLRKYITVNLELSRSPLSYKYNVHELIPEQDQYPPDWEDWPVNHECDTQKPLENIFDKISKSHDEKGSRFWNVQNDAQYNIKAVPIKHRIPCFGYVIQECDKPGKLDVEKAKKLGVKAGPDLGILKSGKSVIAVGTGQEIKPEDVLGEPIKGKKVVVLGDTCDTTEIAAFSQYADYIIHEATMEDSLKTKAIEYGHSTPSMAAKFAINVKGRKLCLTHLSPRYKPISLVKPEDTETAHIIWAEAKKYLEENNVKDVQVVVAEDFFEDTVHSAPK